MAGRSVLLPMLLAIAVTDWTGRCKAQKNFQPPVIAQSDFRFGDDSWSIQGRDAEPYKAKGLLATKLAAKGNGKAWFFVAPSHFLGDKVLSFASFSKPKNAFFPLSRPCLPSC